MNKPRALLSLDKTMTYIEINSKTIINIFALIFFLSKK